VAVQRPPLEIRHLIRKMSLANSLWATTDSWRTYQARHRCRANHRGKVKVYCERKATAVLRVEFLHNHADGIASMDLFVVPTIIGTVILHHDRSIREDN